MADTSIKTSANLATILLHTERADVRTPTRIADEKQQSLEIKKIEIPMLDPAYIKNVTVTCLDQGTPVKKLVADLSEIQGKALDALVSSTITNLPFANRVQGADIMKIVQNESYSSNPVSLAFPVSGDVTIMDAICAAPLVKGLHIMGTPVSKK